MAISSLVGLLTEKLTEKYGEESARWILSGLQERAGPMLADLINMYVPEIPGVRSGGQWALSELQKHALPNVTGLAEKWGHQFVGQGVEELLQVYFPELDEIPGEVLSWLDETKLAEIGRASPAHLSAEARSKIETAGYTVSQLGATVVLHVVGTAARLEDWAGGESETA